MEPRTVLASQEVLERIDRVCKRRFRDENEAHECYLFVLESLKTSDYKRLRSFSGKSSLTTYIYSVTNALAIDFQRAKYGRRRIPETVQKLGELAEKVYRLVCWQRYSYRDAYEIILTDHQKPFAGSYGNFILSTEKVRQAPCPENPCYMSLDDPSHGAQRIASSVEDNPLDLLLEKLDDEKKQIAIDVIRQTIDSLNEDEKVLVRLMFGEDQSAAASGRVLGIGPEAARKRMKSLLLKFRASLFEKGIRDV